jgi:hypothetical protein
MISDLVVERKRDANADAVNGQTPDEATRPGARSPTDADVARPNDSGS